MQHNADVLTNAGALTQAMNASVQGKAADALKTGAQKIASGTASRIKINQYMTLYNANTTGKGKPRPRIRIQGLPIQVISPALGAGARLAAVGGSASARALMASGQDLGRLGLLARKTHWSGVGAMFNKGLGAGILTFAPSAAIDAYNSFERDLHGDRRFNGEKFRVASAKSQSGNLAGWAGGMGVGAIAVFMGASAVGAPVILLSLFAGFAIQVVWGWQGGSEMAESAAKAAFAK